MINCMHKVLIIAQIGVTVYLHKQATVEIIKMLTMMITNKSVTFFYIKMK